MYLYHNVSVQITINETLRFNVCHSINIKSSVQVLTNTATIKLPREFRNAKSNDVSIDISGKSILDYIKRGDKIRIELGYDGSLETEFEGYIKSIGSDIPLELYCEDEMTKLKTAPRVTKSIDNGDVESIIKACLPSIYTLQINEKYILGKWILNAVTPYEVLEELKTKAGIRGYFVSPSVLKVGMIVDFVPENTWELDFSKNIRRGSDLKFERAEDNPLKVIVESKNNKGKLLTYEVGDQDGDVTKIKLPEGLTQDQLKKWGDNAYNSRSYNGFKGSLSIWCEPRVKAGDSVQLIRPFYKDRHQDGTYFVESVDVQVDRSCGIKRTLKLGYKL